MAFLVEDGTGLSAANSYASHDGYVAYWTERGSPPTELQAAIEAALIRATDYLDRSYRWRGIKLTDAQALEWPRYGVYREASVDTFASAIEGVPVEVAKAAYELAKRGLAGELSPDPTVDATGQVVVGTRKKVGPIEVETTFNGGRSAGQVKRFPTVDRILRNLVVTEGGRVWRA